MLDEVRECSRLLWNVLPKQTTLQTNEVHLWRAALSDKTECVSALEQTLATDERQRAERFCGQAKRDRFIVTRALLRAILGFYLNIPPHSVRLSYHPRGKPALDGETYGKGLRFNLSHSGDLALYGITWDREIGVDVEYQDPDIGFEKIARRFFSADDAAHLRSFPEALRRQAFFRGWTRKEALLKATGEGIMNNFRRCDVMLAHTEQPSILSRAPSHSTIPERWSLLDLSLGAQYAGSLVVQGQIGAVKCWDYSEEISDKFERSV